MYAALSYWSGAAGRPGASAAAAIPAAIPARAVSNGYGQDRGIGVFGLKRLVYEAFSYKWMRS